MDMFEGAEWRIGCGAVHWERARHMPMSILGHRREGHERGRSGGLVAEGTAACTADTPVVV